MTSTLSSSQSPNTNQPQTPHKPYETRYISHPHDPHNHRRHTRVVPTHLDSRRGCSNRRRHDTQRGVNTPLRTPLTLPTPTRKTHANPKQLIPRHHNPHQIPSLLGSDTVRRLSRSVDTYTPSQPTTTQRVNATQPDQALSLRYVRLHLWHRALTLSLSP